MIRLPINGSVEPWLARVEQAVVSMGGQFKGDAHKGEFAGKTLLGEVRGTYRIGDDAVSIDIVRKPAMVPMGLIEKEIRGFFSKKQG
jgi:hypothetical protein